MIRKLLATTAVATLISTGAIAQTQPAPAAEPAAQAPMVIKAEGNLASNIIGENVYNGAGDEAENIGEVNDLVLTPEGDVQAVVIGVGGFLGLGQKDVAIEYDLVEWVERDGNRYMVVETTADALKAQQEFDRAAYRAMPADADVAETKPATKEDLAKAPVAPEGEDTAAAPTDGAAPADNMAAAPAPADNAAPAEQAAEAPAVDTAPAQDTAQAPAEPNAAAPADKTAEAPADQNAAAPAEKTAEDNTAATDDTATSAIDRASLKAVASDQIRAEDLIGTAVYGANDEHVGEIGDVVMSLEDNAKIDAVIIDVGGFLGIGEKEVAIGMDNLEFMADADGNHYLYTRFTEEQLEAQPEYDESSYAERRDEMRMVVPN